MIEKERKELEASKPDFPRAMGVMDGPKPADQAINLRGSHWTLGPIVPRGFLHAITVKNPPVDSRRAERPAAVRRVVDAAGPSSHQPRHGQSHLALAFWPWNRPHHG